ncbi:hypothetical protein [Streptomyces sp. NBC_01481]|uniref:hypothetical protein n=1 Tax=Streptomyces sp. NBC_01481 TaxID=2975869 RepID=UPI00225B86E2|nr:hypothetical protein [Streptomyces sp. NBC_01481]MCX4586178.1 hypothetical protein [Streptomyces sp. NBC_01481]
MPEPNCPPPGSSAAAPEPTRHQALDVVVLVGVCAGVYRAVAEAGFSVIIGGVARLYGTWRFWR